MMKCRKYCYLCLFSVFLMFSNSIIVLGDLIFNTITEESIDKNDLAENESESENETEETNTSEEGEEEPARISFKTHFAKNENPFTFHYREFIWNNYSPNIPKEPPKTAVS